MGWLVSRHNVLEEVLTRRQLTAPGCRSAGRPAIPATTASDGWPALASRMDLPDAQPSGLCGSGGCLEELVLALLEVGFRDDPTVTQVSQLGELVGGAGPVR